MPRKSAPHLLPRSVEWDTKVPGLFKRVGARGAVFYVFYRTKQGRQRKMKLGDARVLGLEPARKRALEVLGQVARGEDPVGNLHVREEAHTVEDLHRMYTQHHAEKRQKPSVREYTERIWQLHLLPFLRTKPPIVVTPEGERLTKRKRTLTKQGESLTVKAVTVTHCMDRHYEMRSTPYMANRTMEVLHAAFELAIRLKWVSENPVKVEAYPEFQRRRKPTPQEAVAMFSAMDRMREERPHFIALIELLAITGCRRSEIMTARWEWVHEDGLHLPDSKTGERIVPLNRYAQDVLGATPREVGNPHIIVGKIPGTHLVSPKKSWKTLLKNAGITGLRMHDLRRFFAAAGVAGGLTLEQVGQLLGHKNVQTTRRYAWLLTGAATAASEVVANQIRKTPN
jgi:integrase